MGNRVVGIRLLVYTPSLCLHPRVHSPPVKLSGKKLLSSFPWIDSRGLSHQKFLKLRAHGRTGSWVRTWHKSEWSRSSSQVATSERWQIFIAPTSTSTLDWAEARSLEFSLGLPNGWQNAKYLSSYLLFPSVHLCRNLESEAGSRCSNIGAGVPSGVSTARPNTCPSFKFSTNAWRSWECRLRVEWSSSVISQFLCCLMPYALIRTPARQGYELNMGLSLGKDTAGKSWWAHCVTLWTSGKALRFPIQLFAL